MLWAWKCVVIKNLTFLSEKDKTVARRRITKMNYFGANTNCRRSSKNFFALQMDHSRPLFIYFRLFNTIDSKQIFDKRLNRGSLLSEATALPLSHNHCPPKIFFAIKIWIFSFDSEKWRLHCRLNYTILAKSCLCKCKGWVSKNFQPELVIKKILHPIWLKKNEVHNTLGLASWG